MIIHGDTMLEVGSNYRASIIAPDGVWHKNIKFLVLRVASREEYISFCKETGGTINYKLAIGPYYYEVSTD